MIASTEPFAHDDVDARVGVVLCHGFTGSPTSLRPWANFLADAGMSVRLPRLPGHGTRWQDLQLTRWTDWFATVETAFLDLRARCDHVVLAGLSMGATLALRVAETHVADVTGVIAVNPSLTSRRRALMALPLLEKVIPSVNGIGNDIAKPHVRETGYDRTPLRALRSLTELWSVTRADLGRIDQPLLVFRSAVDHLVEPDSTALLLNGVSSPDVEERVLHRSFHVATLDYDAEIIFTESVRFIRRITAVDVAPSPSAVQD